MQRVLVLGPPGSGKSTVARRVGAFLGLPVFHLDQAYLGPGWVAASPNAFRSEVERFAGSPAWVIDGNFIGTIAPRLRAADTVIYLDVPAWRSVMRVTRRALTGYGRVRRDAAAGCPERLDLAFLHFTWRWNRLCRVKHLAIVERFPGRKIVLRTKADCRRMLKECRRAAGLAFA